MTWPQNDFLHSAICIWIFVTCLWVVSVLKKNASIIDPFWSITITLGGVAALFRHSLTPQKCCFWRCFSFGQSAFGDICFAADGAKKALGIKRFAKIMGPSDIGGSAIFKCFYCREPWLLLSLPIQSVVQNSSSTNPSLIDCLGAAIFFVGFVWEVVGDHQLEVFKKNLTTVANSWTRAWALSRHPNYFGEALLWWGLWIGVIDEPWGLYTVVSPILINFLLVKVSGVSMLEARLIETKPGFKEYMQRTPAFIPKLRR